MSSKKKNLSKLVEDLKNNPRIIINCLEDEKISTEELKSILNDIKDGYFLNFNPEPFFEQN